MFTRVIGAPLLLNVAASMFLKLITGKIKRFSSCTWLLFRDW